jgi:Na+-translocating ferredoxin:NAD+ oxidoreductase RnfG subunit
MAIIYATGPETLLVILILVGVSMLAVGAGAVVYEFGCGMISQEDSLKAAVKAIKDIGELDARVLETHNEQLNNRVNKYLACSSVDKAGFEILRTLMADGYTGSIKDVMLMSVKLAA